MKEDDKQIPVIAKPLASFAKLDKSTEPLNVVTVFNRRSSAYVELDEASAAKLVKLGICINKADHEKEVKEKEERKKWIRETIRQKALKKNS